MAEEEVTVLSTVVLPETANGGEPSPSRVPKRRASSASSSASKRLRLDLKDATTEVTKPAPSKRTGADIDERTRGRRLFGGLLGTLSQNSSTTTHRRRVDIEQKQRDKLKVQKEEDEEVKKQRLEELNTARMAKQKIWDAESIRIQHDNQRTLARFLKTKSMPVLYYKPWELLPEEEDQIRKQIEEVEQELQIRRSTSPHAPESKSPNDQQRDQQPPEDTDMVGNHKPPDNDPEDNNADNSHTPISHDAPENGEEGKASREEPHQSNLSPKEGSLIAEENHASPDAAKDGLEEMVQGDEDAVLY